MPVIAIVPNGDDEEMDEVNLHGKKKVASIARVQDR